MRFFLPFIISFILTIIITKFIILFQKKRKIGQIVREEGPIQHYKKSGTPTAGGIVFLIILFITYLLIPKTQFTNNLILFVFLQSLIGLFDDLTKLLKTDAYGLKARYKIVLQTIFSIPFILFLIKNYGTYFYLPILNRDIFVSTPIFVVVTLFLSVGALNSFNFTDGLDGLLAGLSFFLIIFFIFFFFKNSLSVPLFSIGGSILGFLWFNFHPAEVFMGDTGSSFLGAFFIFYLFSLKLEIIAPILMLIFGIETISVIIQVLYFKYTRIKYKEGKRVFKMAPIHHHFELLGIPEEKITVRFWIFQILLIVISFWIIFIK
ncbi:MAG: phospho-N-acetylmuramoyl-pentapeptide-transferase [Caldisericia bacterium]